MIATVKAEDIEKIAKGVERYRKIQARITQVESPNCSFDDIVRQVLGDLNYDRWLTPDAKATLHTELRVTAINVLTDQLEELKGVLEAQGVVFDDAKDKA
jgi:hypothetical protein